MHIENAVLCRFFCVLNGIYFMQCFAHLKRRWVYEAGFHVSRSLFHASETWGITIKNAENGGFLGVKGRKYKVFLAQWIFMAVEYQLVKTKSLRFCIFAFCDCMECSLIYNS